MPTPKVWFITGSSSGFGRYMTERVLKNGDIAIATLRKPAALSDLSAKYPSDKLLVLKLDVTKPEEIKDAFAAAEKKFGRIDVVFNNAGYCVIGEVEGTMDNFARPMFEVNFWSAVNVTREAVRFFREVNKPAGGRLLQNSSVSGIEASPAFGFYCASKFALEGLTESLAAELDPEWNIKITLVEPGAFRTDGLNNMTETPEHTAYTNPTLPSLTYRKVFSGDYLAFVKGDGAKAVEQIYRLTSLAEPPLHFPLGKGAAAGVKRKAGRLIAETEQYESYSDAVEVD